MKAGVLIAVAAALAVSVQDCAAAPALPGSYADKTGKVVLEIRSEGAGRALYTIGASGPKREGQLTSVAVDRLLCGMIFPGQSLCNGMICEVADQAMVCDITETPQRSTVQATLSGANLLFVRGSGEPVPLRKSK
ncbi:MAG: hypothetical protein RL341_1751 [Pseudomonadota bacterium]|jgi:hypothetical protein